MSLSSRLKRMIRRIYIMQQRRLRGVDLHAALFTSYGGETYSDNPRAVSEALHRAAPDWKITWVLDYEKRREHIPIPDYVHVIKVQDKKAFFRAVATCGTWVTNFGFPDIPKAKEQFFVQTWHGDRAFKKILYDSPFASAALTVPEAEEGFCDLAVAGSDYGEKQYRSAFRYRGKILKVGTPRDDALVFPSEERAAALRRYLGLEDHCRYLLYAPTLRRKNQNEYSAQSVGEIDLERVLDVLRQRDGQEWKCLLRGHPAVRGLTGVEQSSRFIDASGYEDMTDLLLAADMLITDYSSCAGDFALLRRPIVLYQQDLEAYMATDRNFYFDMKDSPYFIARSQEELETVIAALTEESARENCEEILRFYGTHECGHASEELVRIILERNP